jgi:hypothetical protein
LEDKIIKKQNPIWRERKKTLQNETKKVNIIKKWKERRRNNPTKNKKIK